MGIEGVRNNQQLIQELQKTVLDSLPSPIISPELISLNTHIEVVLPGKKTNKSTMKLSPISPLSSILPYLQNICSEMNAKIKGELPKKLLVNGVEMGLQERIGGLSGKKMKIEGLPIEVNIYCFTYGWEKSKVTDFYHCKDCNVKWICENCCLLCHKGHNAVIQLKEHRPDWACCYCVTKCHCLATNKNSIIK